MYSSARRALLHLAVRQQQQLLMRLRWPLSTAAVSQFTSRIPDQLCRTQPSFRRSLSSAPSSSPLSPHGWRRPPAAISVDEARRLLTVAWPKVPGDERDSVSVLPLAWLRDSCQCPSCYDANTQSRTLHFKDFDPRVPVEAAHLSADMTTLTVEWQDGHRSSFAKTWLQERSFTDQARLRRQSGLMFATQEKSWHQELAEFNYSELMRDDSTLLRLLRHLDGRGCLLVKEAPAELSTMAEFAGRLAGFLSPSNYGPSFEVRTKTDPSNAAFTSDYLGLHIDLSFYSQRLGVQILHCISQPSDGTVQGGESLLADGFLAAKMMRRSFPEYYRALTSLPVDFNDYGTDFVGDYHFINRETVLRLGGNGEVDRVTFSSHTRDDHQNHLPPEQVQLLYDALKTFYEILSQPPCIIEHKMHTGDIQLVDNRRVLHGRRAFSVFGAAERFLHGGYVEWDDVYSRIRRLEQARQLEEAH